MKTIILDLTDESADWVKEKSKNKNNKKVKVKK